jgi:hypothetical protein
MWAHQLQMSSTICLFFLPISIARWMDLSEAFWSCFDNEGAAPDAFVGTIFDGPRPGHHAESRHGILTVRAVFTPPFDGWCNRCNWRRLAFWLAYSVEEMPSTTIGARPPRQPRAAEDVNPVDLRERVRRERKANEKCHRRRSESVTKRDPKR